ncbi:hypothetical protein HMPREF0762_01619 [Slackia exigua ATCC 700122]|uniref:Uncharacterized protein n=1 Tax=Slackia exigua (strain ATCC 700122 / DSM 15923 / CIP 105133 / JCM 11022 / KCTC 5966 / S-7) TaxID=649764 RepID=D0WIE4_SLAES|nr:hypothetical protein HMPREF0762_01619 [Slackia exigua ATCC 700122]
MHPGAHPSRIIGNGPRPLNATLAAWPSLTHAAEANRRDLGARRAVSSTHPAL